MKSSEQYSTALDCTVKEGSTARPPAGIESHRISSHLKMSTMGQAWHAQQVRTRAFNLDIYWVYPGLKYGLTVFCRSAYAIGSDTVRRICYADAILGTWDFALQG